MSSHTTPHKIATLKKKGIENPSVGKFLWKSFGLFKLMLFRFLFESQKGEKELNSFVMFTGRFSIDV